MTEAEIVAVLVREGDVIREDAPLLEVETDKAQVEIPSPMGGRVEKVHVQPGQTVKVGAPLVTFADGAAEPAAAPAPSRSAPAATAPARAAPQPRPRLARVPKVRCPRPPHAAPRRELGVDLQDLRGGGPGGRVLDGGRARRRVRIAGAPAPARRAGRARPTAGTVGSRPRRSRASSSGARWSARRSPTCAAPSPTA